MNGARKYAELFKTGQCGRLYITSGQHPRGKTFHIQVLPEGAVAKGNGSNNTCLNGDAVEVYGVTGGNPGWTETYGWLHKGPWQKDFEKLVVEANREVSIKAAEKILADAKRARENQERDAALLAQY